MSPIQALPSFNLALHPDHHYTTVLPNILYPSRPSAHIPWSGPSAPLVFSVSQTIFFSTCLPQPYFFGPQKTTRPEITVASPSVQVSFTFSLI